MKLARVHRRRTGQRKGMPGPDRRQLAFLLLAMGLTTAFGMDGLVWNRVPVWASAPARIGMAVLISVIVTWHFAAWPRRHHSQIPSDESRTPAHDRDFRPLDIQAQSQIIHRVAMSDRLRIDWNKNMFALEETLRPESSRLKTVERVAIAGRITHHSLMILAESTALIRFPSYSILILSRPRKDALLHDVTIRGRDGDILPGLSFIDNAALIYQLFVRALPELTSSAMNRRQWRTRMLILRLILNNANEDSREKNRMTLESYLVAELRRITVPSRSRVRNIERLTRFAADRRLLCAMLPPRSDDESEIAQAELSYTEAVQLRVSPGLAYDWWRERKSRMRSRLKFPPRVIDINADRSRSSQTYQLHVTAPRGLYISDARAWATLVTNSIRQPLWLNSLHRHTLYRAFIEWKQPTDAPTTSLSTRNFIQSHYKQPYFRVQINEIPPGTLGSAFILSLAVTLSVWLAGILGSNGDPQSTDFVAVTVASLGIMSSWLILGSRGVDGSYRSVTGLVSLASSTLLAVGAIVLYIGQHSEGSTGHFPRWSLPRGKTIFWVHDVMWVVALLLTALNLVVTGGTLAMRWRMFTTQRSGLNPIEK